MTTADDLEDSSTFHHPLSRRTSERLSLSLPADAESLLSPSPEAQFAWIRSVSSESNYATPKTAPGGPSFLISGGRKRKLWDVFLRSASSSKRSPMVLLRNSAGHSLTKTTISDDSNARVFTWSMGDAIADVALSGPPCVWSNVSKQIENRKSCRRKKERLCAGESPDLSFDDLPDTNLKDYAAIDIGSAAIEWLDQLNNLRSGKIKPRISGQMKTRLGKIKQYSCFDS